MLEPGDVFSRICPACGKGKLSYANNAKRGSDPRVKVYRRKCNKCGAIVVDTVKRSREVETTSSVDSLEASLR